MDTIVLSLRECTKGWRIFQADEPLFWFQDYEEAVATAQMVAETHAEIREITASIELQLQGERPVHLKTLVPRKSRPA